MRTMRPDDVDAASDVWLSAFSEMRHRYGLPEVVRTPEAERRTSTRIAHLLATDPDLSTVGVDSSGALVGVAQALVRDGIWVLSMLGVDPSSQDRGLGRALLDRALASSVGVPGAMILSSRDPRAMHRYVKAGFDLHPA